MFLIFADQGQPKEMEEKDKEQELQDERKDLSDHFHFLKTAAWHTGRQREVRYVKVYKSPPAPNQLSTLKVVNWFRNMFTISQQLFIEVSNEGQEIL